MNIARDIALENSKNGYECPALDTKKGKKECVRRDRKERKRV